MILTLGFLHLIILKLNDSGIIVFLIYLNAFCVFKRTGNRRDIEFLVIRDILVYHSGRSLLNVAISIKNA